MPPEGEAGWGQSGEGACKEVWAEGAEGGAEADASQVGGRGGWEAEALEGEWADLSVVKGRCSPRGTEGRH